MFVIHNNITINDKGHSIGGTNGHIVRFSFSQKICSWSFFYFRHINKPAHCRQNNAYNGTSFSQ